MKITDNSTVTLIYTLRYDNAQGEVIEEISKENPIEITIGNDDLLEKIEKKIKGLESGSTFEITLLPKDAYGEYDEEGIVSIPKAELLADAEDVEITEGEVIPIVTDDDEDMQAIVLEIDNDIYTLDFNHPLAGETLYFSGEIIDVKN